MATDRAGAQALIDDGRVTVGGAVAEKGARQVAPGEAIEVAGDGPLFVSRGGEKLAAALERFDIDPAGLRVIDAGSSTGGFTDCLLKRGAATVVAIDVGRNQLHEKLRADPRVVLRERTNIRHIGPDEIGGAGALVVADLSFISLRTVAAALIALTEPGGELVLLVKPQFEAAKAEADRGRGVIRDPQVWRRTLIKVCGALAGHGAAIMGVMASPITGVEGNVEFLVHARPDGSSSPAGIEAMCGAAIVEAAPR